MTFNSSSVTCLLGPSGCGKTTLMRMIAGLQEPTSGEIYFGDQRVTHLSPRQRDIGMVFQYPVNYRGLTVRKSIELPLLQDIGMRRLHKERKERVDDVLEALDIADVADMPVSRLNNATLQKAAVARAVARQPRIILFDEPITNVDVHSKVQLKQALKKLVKQHAQTIVYVTHDQTEAMTLADEIALMKDGKIVQLGTPRDLYNYPNNEFGGWFLGNPGMNFIEYDVTYSSTGPILDNHLFGKPVHINDMGNQKEVLIGIRPERIRVYRKPTETSVRGIVIRSSIVIGGQYLLTIQVGQSILKAKVPHDQFVEDGKEIHLECPIKHVRLFSKAGEYLDVHLTL
jgi:ABC-type sugar transport system ATPase subunit